jgi:transaldolase
MKRTRLESETGNTHGRRGPSLPADALVIFGATGDLAHKMIFPALYAMARHGDLNVPVIGVAIEKWSLAQLRKRAQDSIRQAGKIADKEALDRLLSQLRYVDGDYNAPATFTALRQALGDARRPAHYLAIPPHLFATVIQGLGTTGLGSSRPGPRNASSRAPVPTRQLGTQTSRRADCGGRKLAQPRTHKKGKKMKTTQQLHDLGQSLWLDNITRELLTSGTLARYISELSITGLTSNPTIFDHAVRNGDFYDDAIRQKTRAGKSGEALFLELALEDLSRAADLFRPVHDATGGIDGWVSLEVSPLLASDTAGTIKAAAELHARAQRPNLFIKIPGTPAGIPAVEESIFAGVPVNVTLLFSREHYLAAAEAYMRGIERRLEAGLDPGIACVASLFVSRWDVAVKDKVPETLRNRLGIAIAMRAYKAYRDLLAAPRWRKLAASGARPQRLLWASTGTKDPAAPETLYVEALAAPDTINTLPEKTLHAFAGHGKITNILPPDGGDAEAVIAEFARAGISVMALAAELQRAGAEAFAKSWNGLMDCLAAKSAGLALPGAGGVKP